MRCKDVAPLRLVSCSKHPMCRMEIVELCRADDGGIYETIHFKCGHHVQRRIA